MTCAQHDDDQARGIGIGKSRRAERARPALEWTMLGLALFMILLVVGMD